MKKLKLTQKRGPRPRELHIFFVRSWRVVITMIHNKLFELMNAYEDTVTKKNRKSSFYNGIYDRWENPVLTRGHIPVFWQYDFDIETNPHAMERLGVNAVFNSGALYKGGKYYLVARVEGNDRKSFFAVAESENGVEGFRFWDYPIVLPDACPEETNVYDMRLTAHEDGWIYGVFCSESKDNDNSDLSAAKAAAGIVRTKDLKSWERLPNLKAKFQQRNVVLHPEFVDGKYAFYTRPQDGFIDTGSGGGIGFALCEDITKPEIKEEKLTSLRKYHTITEAKNGAGAVPIKTEKGWIHIAHGVRNTAAGLRYVIYVFATALNDPSRVIAEPGGFFIAPLCGERVGDVSNVAFTNGAAANEKGEVFIYYASSDTRLHVATTTLEKLVDYTFNTPSDPLRSPDCVKQRCGLIESNLKILQGELEERRKIDYEYQRWLACATRDAEIAWELRNMAGNENEKLDCFYQNLSFGTGGLRGKMGAGTNRMNIYTVGKVTQGIANYLKKAKAGASACIGYDTRNNSALFAKSAADILCANGIDVYLFECTQPTPLLSFAVREKKADCGIVITASHNPKEYNGYKVYGADGCQLTDDFANAVLNEIEALDIFKDIIFESTGSAGKLYYMGEDVDSVYFERVKELVMRRDLISKSAGELKIIYTPIHGSGNKPVRRILAELGFSDVTVVPEQELPNGDFPTAPYPNPEDASVFIPAMKMAEGKEIDLIFGTDPDCDRIGVLAKDENGKFAVLTGNQTGILLCDYIIQSRKAMNSLPENAAVINTIVTGDLVNIICEKEGVACYNVLTGFKYIGEKIGEWEKSGEKTPILSFEESYGYLAGNFVRDKDAVIASALIAEMALYYKIEKGMTLYQALQDVYARYGYSKEVLINVTMAGKDGKEKMAKIMENLRHDYSKVFEGQPLKTVEDFKKSERVFTGEYKNGTVEKIDLPSSNVLKFTFEDSSWLVLRPSGTEPKIKLYLFAVAKTTAQSDARIEQLKAFVDKIL